MKITTIELPDVILTIEEWESLPEDQEKRYKDLQLKLNQYRGMFKTFVVKELGELPNHRKLQELTKDTPATNHLCYGCSKK